MRKWTWCLLVALPAVCSLAGCSGEGEEPSTVVLPTSPVETVAADPDSSLKWPQFLLPLDDGLFSAQGRELLQLEETKAGLTANGPVAPDLTLGLDRLVAAARGPDGAIALLDSSGQVSVRTANGRLAGFATDSGQSSGAVAIAGGSVYLLLQGELEGGSAVVELSLDGRKRTDWGEMPADGLIQNVLRGGGLAACPDGRIYYSYINSATPWRLAEGGRVEPVGSPPESFMALRRREIRRAFNEGNQERSTQPLVRLGLGASRVMGLFCSRENLLFRQVAASDGAGARIEVWNPVSDRLEAIVPDEKGVLLAVEDHTLYLGAIEDERFELRKLAYRWN